MILWQQVSREAILLGFGIVTFLFGPFCSGQEEVVKAPLFIVLEIIHQIKNIGVV